MSRQTSKQTELQIVDQQRKGGTFFRKEGRVQAEHDRLQREWKDAQSKYDQIKQEANSPLFFVYLLAQATSTVLAVQFRSSLSFGAVLFISLLPAILLGVCKLYQSCTTFCQSDNHDADDRRPLLEA